MLGYSSTPTTCTCFDIMARYMCCLLTYLFTFSILWWKHVPVVALRLLVAGFVSDKLSFRADIIAVET